MVASRVMRRFWVVSLLAASFCVAVWARHSIAVCGTNRETTNETLFLHRQSVRTRLRPLAAAPISANRDIGNIAIIEDTDGVVARQNEFNLDLKTLAFIPAAVASHYSYAVSDGGYDAAAASAGTPLAALDDDDSRQFTLPFAFPFFGVKYTQIFVNSDGNLTFTVGDSASTERSLGRMTAGPPRISPLFDDLDPALTAGGVRMLADATRVVVSWVKVPEWEPSGIGRAQTMQARLYPDGRIEFSYSGVTPTSAVVGIAPGNLIGATSLVDFRNDASGDYGAAVAERFGGTLQVDPVTTAQKFFATHEDSYDYLMIYNNEGIPAGASAVAYENTVRSNGSGYGLPATDIGRQYGSASRLQSVINMGNLAQYPVDPGAIVPSRQSAADTPLTIMAHETGHLFLAYASVRDANDPSALPMLNTDHVHWSFVFDSEASMVEGERIVDRGTSASPQFLTTDTSQEYAPLDQYLMGFRPASQVPPGFYVANAPGYLLGLHPSRNVAFDGVRRDFTIQDVISAEGRRTPDDTVAQRRFRFAIILVVAQGSQPSAADLAQVDTYRQQFEASFANAASGNATADTSLKRSMRISLYPSAGVVAGLAATASLTLATAPASDMTVQLMAPNGNATLPASVKIPAGATSASFTVAGVKAGVEEVTAAPGDPSYETAFSRVQVAGAGMLKLVAVSGDRQLPVLSGALPDPIVVRLTDANNLAYAGARIVATASAGGSVTAGAVMTDAQGQAAFRWTPGPAAASELQLALGGVAGVSLTISSGSAAPVITAVVNAASFVEGLAAGGLQTVTGVNFAGGQKATAAYPWPASLGGVQVLLNGSALPVFYVSDTQINFCVPPDAAQGTGVLTVVTPSGTQATSAVNVAPFQPGIFAGAVLHAGTAVSAVTTAVSAGDYIEIYCTGLGPTHAVNGLQQTLVAPVVFVGATPVTPVFSGLTGVAGLYQVNVQVPGGLAPGMQPLLMSVSGAHSNEISIAVQ